VAEGQSSGADVAEAKSLGTVMGWSKVSSAPSTAMVVCIHKSAIAFGGTTGAVAGDGHSQPGFRAPGGWQWPPN
jgi:hypothetical protein